MFTRYGFGQVDGEELLLSEEEYQEIVDNVERQQEHLSAFLDYLDYSRQDLDNDCQEIPYRRLG